MSSFTGQKVKDTYQDLLQLGNNNSGLTGTVNYIQDGAGTSGPLGLSTSVIGMSGHIIPAANAQYDIGSAEYKVRHLFLSDNSLHVGNSKMSETYFTNLSTFSFEGGNVGIGTTNPGSNMLNIGETDGGGYGLTVNSPTTYGINLITTGVSGDQGAMYARHKNGAGAVKSLFKVTTSGKVGIGVETPASTLHVKGANGGVVIDNTGERWTQIDFMSGGTAKSFITHDSDVKRLVIGHQATYGDNDGFALRNGSTDVLHISRDGHMGIGGDVSEYSPFTIHGTLSGATTPKLRLQNNTSGRPGTIDYDDQNVMTLGSYGSGTNDGAFAFRTGSASGTERFRVNASGIHVTGDIYKNGTLFAGGSSSPWTTLMGGNINLSAGKAGIGTADPVYDVDVYGTNKGIGITSHHADGTRITHATIGNEANGDGHINLYNDVGNQMVKIHSTESSFFNGGNIGIGTNDPKRKLHLSGDPTIILSDTGGGTNHRSILNNVDLLQFGTYNSDFSSYTSEMVIDLNGKVGIGTNFTAPDVKLEVRVPDPVAGGISQHIKLTSGTDVGGYLSTVRAALTNNAETMMLGIVDPAVGVEADKALSIDVDGNVGIGTVSPAANLHVSKALGATTVLTEVASPSTVGYEIKKTDSTNQHWKIVDGQTVNGVLEFYDATDSATRMAIDGNGNVGIGTNNPDYKFDVGDGSFRFGVDYASKSYGSTSSNETGITYLERMHIGSTNTFGNPQVTTTFEKDGNVGIGVLDPKTRLHIEGSATSTNPEDGETDPTLTLRNTSETNGAFAAINFEGANRISASIRSQIPDQTSGATDGNLLFYTVNSDQHIEAMRIDPNRKVGIGMSDGATTNISGARLHVKERDGNQTLRIQSTHANPNSIWIQHDGVAHTNGTTETGPAGGHYMNCTADTGNVSVMKITNNGSLTNLWGAYGQISDVKLKENVVDATDKTEDLKKVRVVNFNLKTSPDMKQIGVVAQELEEVFPSLIEEHNDTEVQTLSGAEQLVETGETTKSVKYSVFVPMLIKAFQEQQAVIETMQQEIETLKNS